MGEFEERLVVVTADGSRTLFHHGVGEHYHSRHGAVGESRHVFVGMGLDHFLSGRQTDRISILEVGFGTGLNFLLSAEYSRQHNIHLDYCGIEAFPLPGEVIEELDYGKHTDPGLWSEFVTSYPEAIGQRVTALPNCQLQIVAQPLLDVVLNQQYDVVYFDAFAAIHQPEMWTAEVFEKVHSWMKGEGSVFVTYAITGQLKRTMRELGFYIERLPGAPGKREMLRAILGVRSAKASLDQPNGLRDQPVG